MLAAAYRLRRSNDFAAVVRGGRRAGRGAVVVHLTIPDEDLSILDLTGTDQSPAGQPGSSQRAAQRKRYEKPDRTTGPSGIPVRAGFVVSKAVGGAVVRNKVRRRLRHLVAERLDRLPAGAALVVRALPAAAASAYQQLGADLDAALDGARAARPRRGSRRRG